MEYNQVYKEKTFLEAYRFFLFVAFFFLLERFAFFAAFFFFAIVVHLLSMYVAFCFCCNRVMTVRIFFFSRKYFTDRAFIIYHKKTNAMRLFVNCG